ncbi:MAG: hypothetical protein ABSB40_06110 [Nitrososphaeria archaeon]
MEKESKIEYSKRKDFSLSIPIVALLLKQVLGVLYSYEKSMR